MGSKYHSAMPTIIRLIQALYEIDSCSCGGLGHVVIDDNNVEDIHLERTIELCNEEQSKDKPERFLVICIMEYLKLLTEEQRKLLFALMEEKDGNADPDYLDEPSFDVWYEWYMSKHQNDSMHDVIAGTPVQIPESFLQGKYCGGIVDADENLPAIKGPLDGHKSWAAMFPRKYPDVKWPPEGTTVETTISDDGDTRIDVIKREGEHDLTIVHQGLNEDDPDPVVMSESLAKKLKADGNLQAIASELKQIAKDNPIPDDVIRGHRMTDAEAMDAYTPFPPIIDFPTVILGPKPIDPSKMTCKMIYNRGDKDGKDGKGTT